MFFCNDTALQLLLLLLLFSQKEKNINLICDYASFHIIFFFFFLKQNVPFLQMCSPILEESITAWKVLKRLKQSYGDFQAMTIIMLTIPCSG